MALLKIRWKVKRHARGHVKGVTGIENNDNRQYATAYNLTDTGLCFYTFKSVDFANSKMEKSLWLPTSFVYIY